MARLPAFRFRDLPLEIQMRTLHTLIGTKTARTLLGLNKACHNDLVAYFHQNAVFTFHNSHHLTRFLDLARDECLRELRRIRYVFGSEAKPSLNYNPKKDALWNVVHVRSFAHILMAYPELANFQQLEVDFGMEERFSRLGELTRTLSLERILAYENTAMRTIRKSESVLKDIFAGWRLERIVKMQAWRYKKSADDVDGDDYYKTEFEELMEVQEENQLDEAVVHGVTLILTNARNGV